MSDVNAQVVSAADLDFSRSPYFVQNGETSDSDEVLKGHIVRLPSDQKIKLPDNTLVDAKKNDVLFRLEGTNDILYVENANFTGVFDRYLSNGSRVSLSESPTAQFAKITDARDDAHLIDFVQVNGKAVYERAAEIAGVGVERAQATLNVAVMRWAGTEEGKIVLQRLQQAGTDFQSGVETVTKRAKEILASPEVKVVRSEFDKLRGHVGRILGGGHEQGPK